jgi:hypothetical protein
MVENFLTVFSFSHFGFEDSEWEQEAHKIYEKYLKRNATYELNIDAVFRLPLTQYFESKTAPIPHNVFDSSLGIYLLLSSKFLF